MNIGIFCHVCGSKDLKDIGGHLKCNKCKTAIPKLKEENNGI